MVITDGLLTDDFERVVQGAASIADHAPVPDLQAPLTAAELGPDMAAFKQFDDLVHQLALSIADAARERDRGQAVADFRQMMEGCLACQTTFKSRLAIVLGETP